MGCMRVLFSQSCFTTHSNVLELLRYYATTYSWSGSNVVT